MKPEIKTWWCEALTSGKYTQGKDKLRKEQTDGGVTFCCLGVLTDLYLQEKGQTWEEAGFQDWNYLPGDVIKWAEMEDSSGDYRKEGKASCLAHDNDGGQSFKEITETIKTSF